MSNEMETTLLEEASLEAKVKTEKHEAKHLKNNLNLKKELDEISAKYHGKDDIFGMTLLNNPGYISASRNIMFTSHLKQLRNLESPDFPRVFTNYENAVGVNSTAYYKAKHDYIVIKKIPKFGPYTKEYKYLLFIYDKANDKYDVIEKKSVENLTEKFGFGYNTENIDSKQEGDKIKKGEWLYKSTSYDEDNNYCYGKNATFMYALDTRTIEDAIIVSKSFSESTRMIEVEKRTVSVNHNDILINLYGNNVNYKPFPDIGDKIENNILCANRRINNNQVLYDLKLSNLKKINFNSDTICFCDNAEVIDIDMYCNVPIDEIPVNRFNQQIIKYLELQKQYYTEILEICTEIIDSGSDYSFNIGELYAKAKDVLNDNVKWRDSNSKSVFGFLTIEFTVKRSKPLACGQKITGRHGNKGVVKEILDDDLMPVLDNGKRIDVIINTLGVINRINTFQLFEQSITFICNRTQEKLKTIESLEEKEDILFDILGRFNKNQSDRTRDMYNRLSEQGKYDFFEDIYKYGIYVNIKPLWEEDEVLFERISKIYDDYKWIKPYKVYINQFGRKIKMMGDIVVGEMYMLALKQTSSKGFSARSNGNLSQKGVPQKPGKTKENRGKEQYSKTPVRIGIDENYNALIGVDEMSLAKLHLFYRNSVIARRELGHRLITDIEPIEDFETSFDYKNRNVEILNSYFKNMGLRISFDDMQKIEIFNQEMDTVEHDGVLFISPDDELENDIIKYEIEKEFENDFVFVGSEEEIEELKQKRFEIVKERIDKKKYF